MSLQFASRRARLDVAVAGVPVRRPLRRRREAFMDADMVLDIDLSRCGMVAFWLRIQIANCETLRTCVHDEKFNLHTAVAIEEKQPNTLFGHHSVLKREVLY